MSAMSEQAKSMHELKYGSVREGNRSAIYVLRVESDLLDHGEIEDLAQRMRERMFHLGRSVSDVVVVHGSTRETFRLHGLPYSVSKVRAALFNAAISWSPISIV